MPEIKGTGPFLPATKRFYGRCVSFPALSCRLPAGQGAVCGVFLPFRHGLLPFRQAPRPSRPRTKPFRCVRHPSRPGRGRSSNGEGRNLEVGKFTTETRRARSRTECNAGFYRYPGMYGRAGKRRIAAGVAWRETAASREGVASRLPSPLMGIMTCISPRRAADGSSSPPPSRVRA